MTYKEKLIKAYSNTSKHSNYQVLPQSIKSIIEDDDVHTRTRYEAERLHYLLSILDIKDKSVLDIGGNTGYFTYELIDRGAKNAVHYEGNKEHSEFVKLAAQATGRQDRVKTIEGYFSFDGSYKDFHDIILLFNVLHHVGDDYGAQDMTVKDAKEIIIAELNSLSSNCKTMVFQLGFNWQGDVNKPLFKSGTKREMIDFVRGGIAYNWNIKYIGIAETVGEKVEYRSLNDHNIERDESLGEFLNRPIFVLESIK